MEIDQPPDCPQWDPAWVTAHGYFPLVESLRRPNLEALAAPETRTMPTPNPQKEKVA